MSLDENFSATEDIIMFESGKSKKSRNVCVLRSESAAWYIHFVSIRSVFFASIIRPIFSFRPIFRSALALHSSSCWNFHPVAGIFIQLQNLHHTYGTCFSSKAKDRVGCAFAWLRRKNGRRRRFSKLVTTTAYISLQVQARCSFISRGKK